MMKLEISGLSFSYGERQVLEDISFGVAEGEFVSLLGPSGCGKSTVLKLLTGILSPDRGRILVDGEEIRGLSSHFAYMPQNDLLFPWKTILDNVCLYGRIHGSLEEMRERAREYFPVFGLEGYEDSYPASLSGGMRQRCALIRTLAAQPKVLLLDEHTAALDPKTAAKVLELSDRFVAEGNLTTLMVTHNMKDAIAHGNRLIMMNAGKIVFDVSGEEKKRLTVDDLLHAFTLSTAEEFANDRILLS